jgi:hypothetical protein
MFDLKLSPVLVGKTIEDIQRNRAVAERIGMPDSMVRLAAAEHDRKLLFTAIRKEMRAQYLASARDADDAMGLDRFGNPKQEEAS